MDTISENYSDFWATTVKLANKDYADFNIPKSAIMERAEKHLLGMLSMYAQYQAGEQE